MAKEWILNSAMNRFQLNFKNVRTKEHIEELGKKLYVKITEVIQAEVGNITEEDCINYIKKLIINRTFDGYQTEIKTTYEFLQKTLNIEIHPASDEWNISYNVVFFIQIEQQYIGLQIKPVNKGIQLPEIFKEYSLQSKTHKKFTEKFGGKVFYLFSTTVEKVKKIVNTEVIDEIKTEIKRLKQNK